MKLKLARGQLASSKARKTFKILKYSKLTRKIPTLKQFNHNIKWKNFIFLLMQTYHINYKANMQKAFNETYVNQGLNNLHIVTQETLHKYLMQFHYSCF